MEDSLAQAKYAAMTWNVPLSEPHAAQLLDHLSLPDAKSIVDIGCGWGELLLRAAAASPQLKATGIDLDNALLDRGRRNATARNIPADFVQQRGEEFQGTADRAICIGSSHVLGGTKAMLERLAEIVPRGGRVLVGDMFWESAPTEAARAMFGDEALPLADLAALCRQTGWEVLYLTTADQREWDDFESRHRAGPREWLLANPEDPRTAGVREDMDRKERDYLTVYRGVVGYAFLVLGR